MGEKFSSDVVIGYFGVDNDLMLTPTSLTLYFQELAIDHSNSLGYTLDWLNEKRRGWAITNWHIKVYRYPKFGEKIQMTTWSNSCKRMQAERSFKVDDEAGNVICDAMSRWIFMDLEKRRPALLEEGMGEKYCCSSSGTIVDEKYYMPKAFEENRLGERVFEVTRRDTDTNGHTNNTKYIEWAIDDVPDSIYNEYKAEDIKVVYRKECYRGTRVRSICYVKDIEDKKEVLSIFINDDEELIVFAEIATTWIKTANY